MNKFQTSLPMMLQRTLDAIIPLYRDAFKEHNITEQQWRILRVLWETDQCTTLELSNKTLLPGPSMVGIVDRMISKGLVSRVRSKQDRRKVFVSLTPKGSEMLSNLAPRIDEIYQQIVAGCDQESWQTMIETMQRIVDATQPTESSLTPSKINALTG